MPGADFVKTFGDVAEHSPWVAEVAAAKRPFASRAAMIAAFEAASPRPRPMPNWRCCAPTPISPARRPSPAR